MPFSALVIQVYFTLFGLDSDKKWSTVSGRKGNTGLCKTTVKGLADDSMRHTGDTLLPRV
jgi:hypothetical protein